MFAKLLSTIKKQKMALTRMTCYAILLFLIADSKRNKKTRVLKTIIKLD